MQFEIVLKAGQKAIPVGEIPTLIANAMHPQPPEGRSANHSTLIADAENEHRSALMGSVRYGYLTVLSSKTNLPTDETNPLGVVPVEAFISYVAQFGITVSIAGPDDKPAQP